MVEACGAACVGGTAATVGANNCAPQLRQKLSPGAAGVPHFGHIVAFKVGSLIKTPNCSKCTYAGRCFYRETQLVST